MLIITLGMSGTPSVSLQEFLFSDHCLYRIFLEVKSLPEFFCRIFFRVKSPNLGAGGGEGDEWRWILLLTLATI